MTCTTAPVQPPLVGCGFGCRGLNISPNASMGTDEISTRAHSLAAESLRGAIEVRGVVLRYRPNKPPSLNQLSRCLRAPRCASWGGRVRQVDPPQGDRAAIPIDAGSIRLDGPICQSAGRARARPLRSSEPLFLKGSLRSTCALRRTSA